MKKYYVKRGDFGNSYELRYTVTAEQDRQIISDGFERITRMEAFSLVRSERERRKYDQAFSGYADAAVYPFGYDGQYYNYALNGYIAE